MSEFKGSSNKVRCIDCTKFTGKICALKNVSVSPKKKRICNVYDFKGEFENRTVLESMYVPYVDKNTRKLMRKLMKLNVLPNGRDLSIEEDNRVVIEPNPGQLVIPFTNTATAGVVNVGEVQSAPNQAEDRPQENQSQIWTPDSLDE